MEPCSGEADLPVTRAGGEEQHGGPDLIWLHGREAKGGWRIGFLRNSFTDLSLKQNYFVIISSSKARIAFL